MTFAPCSSRRVRNSRRPRISRLRLLFSSPRPRNRQDLLKHNEIQYRSRFFGVYPYSQGGWRAIINCVDKKTKHIGFFEREEDAAAAYNQAAIRMNSERPGRRQFKLNRVSKDADPSRRKPHAKRK